ncbi:MAG: anion permease [Candidatus Eisenbacteria sp.]|nr:anion permease [Candidatus Eisenbacteria bacterium]
MISLPLLVLLGIAGFYVGWNIGANDGGNCIGTSLGAGLISFRRGAVLVAFFLLVGAVLQGDRVVETVGRGIVSEDLPATAVLLVLLSGGLVVSMATFLRIPVSTSQSVVGAVVGVGLSMGANVSDGRIRSIVLSWILCPVMAMLLSAVGYLLLRWVIRRVGWSFRVERIMGWLLLASACYAAYSLGANNAGNIVGPIGNLREVPTRFLLVLSGGAMAIGVITFGRGVAEAIGRGIVPLDLVGALVVQTATGLVIHFYSMIGIPVSTSHTVVGAVIGVGLVRGIQAMGRRKIAEIGIGWIVTPTAAGFLCFLLSSIFVR